MTITNLNHTEGGGRERRREREGERFGLNCKMSTFAQITLHGIVLLDFQDLVLWRVLENEFLCIDYGNNARRKWNSIKTKLRKQIFVGKFQRFQ